MKKVRNTTDYKLQKYLEKVKDEVVTVRITRSRNTQLDIALDILAEYRDEIPFVIDLLEHIR